MLLKSLRLNNFRQYYGFQELTFSTDKNKNITVIHGENGSGKTTLLNAFNWCFYGEVNLPNPKRLANEKTIIEASIGEYIEVFVEINFEDNNRDYFVKRSAFYKKIDKYEVEEVESNFKVTYIDETGKSITSDIPYNVIKRIIPKELKDYFFFDGERIDNLSKENNSDEIRKAVKNIMGLKIIERAIEDLKVVRRTLRKEIKEFGGEESNKINEELTNLENQKAEIEQYINQYQNNEKALLRCY